MKKSNPWWWNWNKMATASSPQDCSGLLVVDYFLQDSGLPAPADDRFFCDDIWKKFELLPTPPRSPSRPSSSSDEEDDLGAPSPLDHKLNLVSDVLDSPDVSSWGLLSAAQTGLKNDLLHDCMWSGQCTDTCKRGHGKPPASPAPSTPTNCSPPAEVECGRPPIPSPALPVDPCTMLPYTPLSDHSYHTQQQQHEQQEEEQQEEQQQQQTTKYSEKLNQPRTPPICDTPSDTEDDEIDVVTLPTSVALKAEPVKSPPVSIRKSSEVRSSHFSTTRRRPPGRPPAVPPLRVVIPASVYANKHKEGRGRKRFSKRHGSTSSSSSGSWSQRRYKRSFSSHNHQERTVSCSSDSEDCVEKRSMHNSMERKRRDDLRYAFQTLREHVPELASNPKAPKVLILNRAASYARQLSQTSAALEKTLKQETRKRQELQRRLMQLSKLK